jgi:hypothetical protein
VTAVRDTDRNVEPDRNDSGGGGMKKQAEDSPRLVVLKLDNGELAEDLTHGETAPTEADASGRPRPAEDRGTHEIVESHGLPDGLVEVDPSDLSPGALPRHARHPSTDRRSHPARIEEEI